jgi:CheY-like chemotaxis protein
MGTATAARARVVVIDADAAILGMIRELLEGEGYAVGLLRAPPTDLTELAPFAPHLIVADLVFPDATDGPAWLHRVAAHPATANIPVVVCSADRVLLDRLAPDLAVLSCAVVEKPFDIADLLAAVAACLTPAARDRPAV